MEVWRRPRRKQVGFPVSETDPQEAPDEGLTGWIGNKKASSREERFARSLRQADIPFQFRVLVYTPYQIPGQNYEIDFVVHYGLPEPIEIDDEWIHRTQDQQEQDNIRDGLIDDQTKYWGWQKIKRIKVDMEWTQTMFDELVETLF